MDLEPLLRAHGFMRVERPHELWEPLADDQPFLLMLARGSRAGSVSSTSSPTSR